MRSHASRGILVATLFAVMGCKAPPAGPDGAPCQPVPIGSQWTTIPLTALKTGTVCSSDAKTVQVWQRDEDGVVLATDHAELEDAGYHETVDQTLRGPHAGSGMSYSLAYVNDAGDEIDLYVQGGTGHGTSTYVSRGVKK